MLSAAISALNTVALSGGYLTEEEVKVIVGIFALAFFLSVPSLFNRFCRGN